MMPPGGAAARAQQLGALERLAHERATSDEVGAWLDEVEGDGDLSDVDRDVVRVARRDWDRQRRVPAELAAARVQAAAEGQEVWQDARARSDFAMFAPALERNVELAREYAACFDDDGHPYDALLADYDYGLTAARVQRDLRPAGAGAAAAGGRGRRAARGARRRGARSQAQQAAVARSPAPAGRATTSSWRVDVSPHPFSLSMSTHRPAGHDALRGRRRRVAAGRGARVRPRALRAPDRARAGAHEPRPRHVDVGPRVPEQAVGEPRRAQSARSRR